MNSIISKRQEYADRLNAINVQIAKDVADYNKELHDEIELKVEKFRSDKIAENAIEIDILQKRIYMLDEMIKEEMPNAKFLEKEVEKPDIIEEKPIEEIKEETIEKLYIEPIQTEIQTEIQESIQEPIQENIEESINEEPIIETIDEPIIEPAIINNEEETVIEEIVTNPINEETVIEEPITQNNVTDLKNYSVNVSTQNLERPGMSSIVLPVRE